MKKMLLAMIGFLIVNRMFAKNINLLSPTGQPFELRGCDPAGCGYFGAPRHGHIHQGLDIKINPGQTIYAPISGRVRTLYVYPDSREMKGVEISRGRIKVKIFYLEPFVQNGSYVRAGDIIGKAQNVADYYLNPNMTPHLHVEVRIDGHLIDPEKYFKNWIK